MPPTSRSPRPPRSSSRPASSKPAGASRRGSAPSRAPAAAESTRECLVCGKPVTRVDANLCLDCVRKGEASKRPRFGGGARTEHGTRVARAVVCVRCGKDDHVAFLPRDPLKHMCKACQAEVVGRDEHGDLIKARTMDIVCPQCGRKARVPLMPPKVAEDGTVETPLCHDCFLGIETNRSDKVRTGERRKSGVILKRRSE